ncbi:hypothetical protein CAP35_01615 [Chitinophagaceae bacterium IBVUCB1]|nr:hypothetical protein CAP35_01615 [Chitinophagaceae bacterium IBVUCB1]
MKDNFQQNTDRKISITAGLSFLSMAILAGFGYGYGFSAIYVKGNPAKTIQALQSHVSLFRMVLMSFILILLLDVFIAWALYLFFDKTNKNLSLLAAWLRLVYAAMLGVAIEHLSNIAMATNGNNTEIYSHFDSFLHTWSWGLIIFGCHLLVVGLLILKTNAIPAWIGMLMLFAGLCYCAINAANVLLPDFALYKDDADTILALPMAAGEIVFALWLLFKGEKKIIT